jgi:phosphinothricin acetyltransferase
MANNGDIIVRHAERGDLDAMTAIYNHYIETTAITFDIKPFTPAEREPWFAKFQKQGPHQLFAAFCQGRLAGYANSSPHREKAAYQTTIETTIYVDREFARKGVGRALYGRLFEVLEGQDLHRAYAGVTLPNPASAGFHRSFGFAEIGTFQEVGRKFGRYHDVLWLEKRL